MLTFIKAQAASVLGSIVDFLITILLVEKFQWGYVLANLTGNICGGTVQFILFRKWAFNADGGKMRIQAFRFILVFMGNIILSAVGIFCFTNLLVINYVFSETITSILSGISFNYYMQKKFVFSSQKKLS